MFLSLKKNFEYDNIGMLSSSLCFVHCMITPFIFIAQACSRSCCSGSPLWWKAFDFIFLLISFVAVYYSAKNTSKNWLRFSFYLLFLILTFLVVNHHIGFYIISMKLNYISAFLLFALHLYNKKFCRCSTGCCKS